MSILPDDVDFDSPWSGDIKESAMSTFDEWYSSKIMWRDERSIPKNLMQEAFNAGLEAARALKGE